MAITERSNPSFLDTNLDTKPIATTTATTTTTRKKLAAAGMTCLILTGADVLFEAITQGSRTDSARQQIEKIMPAIPDSVLSPTRSIVRTPDANIGPVEYGLSLTYLTYTAERERAIDALQHDTTMFPHKEIDFGLGGLGLGLVLATRKKIQEDQPLIQTSPIINK